MLLSASLFRSSSTQHASSSGSTVTIPFRMRNVPLLLLSLLVLHVFLFMVFIVYTPNGAWPCQVAHWCMNLYLLIGIGLFQAQNQQLLTVSDGQAELVNSDELYKPLLPNGGCGIGGPGYWLFQVEVCWMGVSKQRRYECFVIIGIFVQVGSLYLDGICRGADIDHSVYCLIHHL